MKAIQRALGLRNAEVRYLDSVFELAKDKGYFNISMIRRGIGEVLPGTMSVLADTLKVDIKTLAEMIKNKEVKYEVLDDFILEYKKMLIN